MTKPLVVSTDPDLVEELLRLAAVHGIDLQVFEDAGAAGPRWATAPLSAGSSPAARPCSTGKRP